VRAAQKLLGAMTIGKGECPGRGWWWRESKESNTPKIYENGEKTSGFPHFLAYKSLKTPFFAQKYLTRYTPLRCFLRNTSILTFFIKEAIVEIHLFKISEVIYAPSRPDQG
jgi:hypothetical protein